MDKRLKEVDDRPKGMDENGENIEGTTRKHNLIKGQHPSTIAKITKTTNLGLDIIPTPLQQSDSCTIEFRQHQNHINADES